MRITNCSCLRGKRRGKNINRNSNNLLLTRGVTCGIRIITSTKLSKDRPDREEGTGINAVSFLWPVGHKRVSKTLQRYDI